MTAPKPFARRVLLIGIVAAAIMVLLAGRLAVLQLGDIEANRARADQNAKLVTESARGERTK